MGNDKFRHVLLLIVFIVFFLSNARSQYFLTGQDPASVKWEQIKTEHFQLIYPREYTKVAQYYINALSLASPQLSKPYTSTEKLKRLPIILHNRTTTSNASVAIAPYRADFYEMSSQDIYPQIWQDQLVLHEYRHFVQMTSLRQGLTKGLYYVFGQQGIAAVMGLWLPFWFIEGDAVYAETIYSNSGRGRVPNFIYPLQAQILDKKIYKYDKAAFGSFKDFVPDHYTLGYQIVTKGVQEHGTEMWKAAIDQVARRPYYLVPFTTSIKKQTGKYKVQYYNSALKSLRNEWWLSDHKEIDSTTNIVSKENRFFTEYLYPGETDDGSIIVEKTGLDDINRFVLIDANGNEERVFTPGYDFKKSLSVSGDVICWNEKGYDPRWDLRNYSVIKLYNYKTKKLKKITSRSRYFAPDLSNDGKKIVTVHVSHESEYSLHILDAATGKVLQSISTSNNLFFLTPHWSDNDDFIVAMVLGKKGKSLVKISAKTREIEYLMPFTFKEIKWPVMFGDWVVYTGTYEGKDNLYAIHEKTKKVLKVFESRFGANYPTFSKNGKQLYFSYYTADGNKLASLDFKPEEFDEFNLGKTNYNYLIDKLPKTQDFNLDDTIVPEKIYPAKKYKRGANLFNLHSWAPVGVDVNNYTINPGVTILSQNVLSTSVATLSWLYDPNELTHKVKFGYDYYGWYPVISLSVDYGGRRAYYEQENTDLTWRETNLSLTVSVPLNFTHSKWIQGINPSVGIDQKFLSNLQPVLDSVDFKEDRITAPFYRFYAYNQYKRSPKDIYPHWGQSIDLFYRDTPLSESISSQFAVTGWLYFPGFIRHHGLRIYGGYQQTTTGNYSFSNFVAVPRGYDNIQYPEYFTIRSDYAFPVAYPDLNVPGLFYLKRIYSKVFYDYMLGYYHGNSQELSSTGAELYTDWNFLSILVNFNLGVRFSHRFYDKTQRYEFLFGISTNF